jgi:hypothetical protein
MGEPFYILVLRGNNTFLNTFISIPKCSDAGVQHLGLLGLLALYPSPGILKSMFRKLNLFPSSGDGAGDTYPVGSVKRTNLSMYVCIRGGS